MRSKLIGAVLLALVVGCAPDSSDPDPVDTAASEDSSDTVDTGGLTRDTATECSVDDAPCDDGDLCTVDDRCSGGHCVGGSSLPCDDPDPCTVGHCQSGTGCVFTPLPEGDPCTLTCYGRATCQSGTCTPDPTSATPCPESSEPCIARYGCDQETGECTIPIHRPAGTVCNRDDDVCTLDSCDGAGGCLGSDEVEDCATETQNNPCWVYVCAKKTGCTKASFLTDASCNDHNGCTSNDTCGTSPAGQQGCFGTVIPFDDHNPCTNDTCNDGEITHTSVENAVCTVGGNACAVGRCTAGTCQLQSTLDCDDHNPCTSDHCDPENGACTHGAATPCQHGGTCIEGAAACQCPDAYTGPLCDQDVDECATHTATCAPTATCTNTDGGYTCACQSAYSGDGFHCADTDGCVADPCAYGVTCTDVPAPGTGRTCGACPAGTWGGGATCTLCAAVTGCVGTLSCTTAADSVCATCQAGYTQLAPGQPCTDIDECAVDNGGCGDPSAWSCTNTAGSFGCADNDECALGTHDCDLHATCANTPGSFTCACTTGYSGDGVSCADTDGCTLAPCADGVVCTDVPAPGTGRICGLCPLGQWGDGATCTACAPVADCVGDIACTSVSDSVCAECAAGYAQGTAGADCSDVDECATDNGGCDLLTQCMNTPGSRDCPPCPSGYTGDGEVGCSDVDECASDNGGCGPVSAWSCANSAGSFSCADRDECALGTDDCDAHATCTDTVGGFTCACMTGYSGAGTSCADTDGCAEAPCADGVTCTDVAAPGTGRTCGVCAADEWGDGTICRACTLVANCAGAISCTTAEDSACLACTPGYTQLAPGAACSDVDECATDNGGCGAESAWTCTNLPGFFKCTDRDECTFGTDGCDANASCTNTVGGFTCVCTTGYSGDGVTCADTDGCAASPCAAAVACTDVAAPGTGRTCGACPAGTWGDGATCTSCTPVANCAGPLSCAAAEYSVCSACTPGYTQLAAGAACSDVNECATANGGCGAASAWRCTNVPGSFRCSDIDECALGTDDCDAHASCTNTVGGFSCACTTGYSGDGASCVDSDGCDVSPCAPEVSCTDTPAPGTGRTCDLCPAGSWGDGATCTSCTPVANCAGDLSCTAAGNSVCASCTPGYAQLAPGAPCTDVDECATDNGGCDPLTTCTNTPGSSTCDLCPSGYAGSGEAGCADIDECADDPCDLHADCANTDGGYTCTCRAGWAGTGAACSNVNECLEGTTNCLAMATCTDTLGGYACSCPVGYAGDGVTACDDVDECADQTAGCDANATCTNTAGGAICACNAGYVGDGFACSDVNGCAEAPCADGVTCTDVAAPGTGRTCGACPLGQWGDGATCTPCVGVAHCVGDIACTSASDSLCAECAAGYAQGTAGADCADIDECASDNGGCDLLTECINTGGSRTCDDCPDGYTGDGEVGCSDIDECASDNGGCGPASAWTCTNSGGSYSCTDKDECALGTDDCDANAACANTTGGFTCTCTTGYSGDGVSCVDTDGCVGAPCADGVTCTDVAAPGTGRTCGACPLGWWGDGVTCTPCAGVAHCVGEVACTSASDSLCAECAAGYAQGTAGADCADSDECASDNGGCDLLTECTNTAGSRTCGACPSGYTGDGEVGCSDIDECASDNGGCGPVSAWSCTNSAGSFSCTDRDECALGTADCDANAACTNTAGGFTCACTTGYSGDGVSCVDTDGCSEAPCAAGVMCTDVAAPGTGWTCGACPLGQWGDGVTCTPCTPLVDCLGSVECTTAEDSVCVCQLDEHCDDGEACTADTCEADGSCTHSPQPAGTACDDGDPGTWNDECDGDGSCTCKPWTCEAVGFTCGVWPDGCGGTMSCGANPGGDCCGNPPYPGPNGCAADPSCGATDKPPPRNTCCGPGICVVGAICIDGTCHPL